MAKNKWQKSINMLQIGLALTTIIWLVVSFFILPIDRVHGYQALRIIIVMIWFFLPSTPFIIANLAMGISKSFLLKGGKIKCIVKFIYTLTALSFVLVFVLVFMDYSFYFLTVCLLFVLSFLLFALEIYHINKIR